MGWSNAVITNGGLSLIAQAVSGGGTLSITRAGLGGGTVDATALLAQTAITSPLTVPAVISAMGELENGISVRVQIRNTGVTAVQHMKQVGLFARIGEKAPVLFAIMQCDNGIGEEIPPESEYPDFMIEFNAAVAVSNTDNIVVTISTSAVITRGALEEELKNYTTKDSFTALSESVNDLSENKANQTDMEDALAGKADRSDIPAIPASLPANGGNADTVNGHSVNSDVPANAKFTDTVYTHPTSTGNKHIPAGGSSGQILRWSSSGTAVWGSDNNTTYSNMSGATASAVGKSGLVPAPAAGAANRYLRSDGTWQVPPDTNTTYGAASASTNGLMTTGAQTFAGNKTFNGQVLPAGATAYGTPQARKLSSGTATATTANCPAGAWYGQHS